MPSGDLEVKIRVVDQASGPLGDVAEKTREVGDAADEAEPKTGGLSAGFGIMAGAAVAAVGAIVGITAAIGDFVAEAGEAELIQADLEAVLRSTNNAIGMSVDELTGLAESLSQMTMFEDDAIVKAEAMGLMFTNISKDIFPEFMSLTLDLAQRMGTDATNAARTLGRALQEPEIGLTALQRVGIQFSEAQKEMIKGLIESGDAMGAQNLILEEVEKRIGGAAQAAGDTFVGKMEILNNTIGNVKETLGGPFLEAFKDIADVLIETLTSPEVQAAIQSIAKWIGDMITTTRQILADLESGEWGSKLAQTFADAGKQAADSFWASLTEPREPVQLMTAQQMDMFYESGKSAGASFGQGIKDLLEGKGGGVGGISIDLSAIRLENFMPSETSLAGLHTMGAKVAFQVGIGFMEELPGICNTLMKGIDSKMKEAVSNAAEALKKIGESIISGIKKGIEGAWDSFSKWVSDKIGGLLDGIKSALGIGSPAAAMVPIGEAIIEGLLKGLRGATSLLTPANQELVASYIDSIVRQFRDQIPDMQGQVLPFLRDHLRRFLGSIIQFGWEPTLGEALRKTWDRLMEDARDELSPRAAKALGQLMDELLASAGGNVNRLLQLINPGTMMQNILGWLQMAGQFGSFGQAAAQRLEKNVLSPMREELKLLEEQLAIMQEQGATEGETYETVQKIAVLKDELAKKEQLLADLAKQQADLQFIQAQAQLIKMIQENGLNAQNVLGGLKLGLEANLEDVIAAMTRAMQMIVKKAEEALGVGSPSKAFAEIGRFAMQGFGMGALQAAPAAAAAIQGAMTRTTNYNYYLTAQYAYQSESTLIDRIRMLELLHR